MLQINYSLENRITFRFFLHELGTFTESDIAETEEKKISFDYFL